MNNKIIYPPLYLITDRHQTQGRSLPEMVQEAIIGGVRFVQLREKDLPTRQLLSLAYTLRAVTQKGSAHLLINDRLDLCLAVQADGIHLRANSLPVRIVRKILGETKLIGVSTHSLQEAQQAQQEGADFITLGPIYETSSKAEYGPPLGLDVLKNIRKQITIPILALGGITRERIHEVLAAGADGIALISAILMAQEPRQIAIQLLHELEQYQKKVRGNHYSG